jgi:hypothetical protein
VSTLSRRNCHHVGSHAAAGLMLMGVNSVLMLVFKGSRSPSQMKLGSHPGNVSASSGLAGATSPNGVWKVG